MKKLFTTLSNIWKIEDLRARILFTLLCLLIYRIGSFIVIPGVDSASLDDQQAKEGLLGLLNMFAGGSFSRASIFALGVMPYISASIVVQLLGIAVPYTLPDYYHYCITGYRLCSFADQPRCPFIVRAIIYHLFHVCINRWNHVCDVVG
jgi:hypothetical protein